MHIVSQLLWWHNSTEELCEGRYTYVYRVYMYGMDMMWEMYFLAVECSELDRK